MDPDAYIHHADTAHINANEVQVNSAGIADVQSEIANLTAEAAQVEANEADVTAEHAHINTENAQIQTVKANIMGDNTTVGSTEANITGDNVTVVSPHVEIQQAGIAQLQAGEATVNAPIAYVAATHAHINAEVVVQQVQQPAEPQLTAEQIQMQVSDFTKEVRNWSEQQIRGGVTDKYKKHKLCEPVKEYTPQLKEIDFYGGDLANGKEQYTRGPEFTMGEKEIGKLVDLESILSFPSGVRVKAIVGPTGSGKTTLIKRLVRDVLNGRKEVVKQMRDGAELKADFIYFLNVRDIPVKQGVTPCDLLFKKMIKELKESNFLKQGFDWLQENQDKAVFFLEGLDQAEFPLLGKYDVMEYNEKGSPSQIIQNLLRGDLFPDVLIIISSREHTLASLTEDLRPHQVIGLAGFTLEDRKQVFIGLAGEDGENLWNLMCTKSLALVSLSSIPLFNIFIVIVYKLLMDSKIAPDTMSGVMIKLLKIFMRSSQIQEEVKIVDIIHKLKALSFRGTSEKRVNFNISELEELELNADIVRDVVCVVPGFTELGQLLHGDDYCLFFCHQSIQELLTALYIIEKNLQDFSAFVRDQLHTVHWSVVRRFVCGLLLNTDTHEDAKKVHKVSQVDEKKEVLKQSMKEQLKQCEEAQSDEQPKQAEYQREKLELYAALNETKESDNHFFRSNVHDIDFENLVLTPNDIYVISSMLRRCSDIEQLRLKDCDLDTEAFDIMWRTLEPSRVKIKILDISDNREMSFNCLGRIINKCEVRDVFMINCKPNKQKMLEFQQGLDQAKIGTVHVSWNPDMCVDCYTALGEIVRQCHVQNLYMEGCRLDTKKLESFKMSVKDAQIYKFDVSDNEKIDFNIVGQLVRQCQIEDVILSYSGMDLEKIKQFQTAIGDCEGNKLKNLDISYNSGLGVEGFKILGQIARQNKIQFISLEKCDLTTEELQSFKDSVGETKIDTLNVSLNRDMGEDDFAVIGEIIRQCQITDLIVRNCDLDKDKLRIFRESIGKAKVTSLDITRLEDLEDLKEVGNFILQCEIRNVLIRVSSITNEGLTTITEILQKSKIERLDLSGTEWQDDFDTDLVKDLICKCKLKELILRSTIETRFSTYSIPTFISDDDQNILTESGANVQFNGISNRRQWRLPGNDSSK